MLGTTATVTVNELGATFYCTVTWNGGTQTGALDLTAANGAMDLANNAQADADGANDGIENLSTSTALALADIDETTTELENNISALNEQIGPFTAHITIEPSVPYIEVATDDQNYIRIGSDRMSLYADGNENAYLASDRFYSPSSVITNLYMQMKDPKSGDRVGGLGWVARSNGHLSLKRIK